MKFLSDTNAMKIFGAFYCSKIFTQLSDFYICWTQRCTDNHNFIREILIKAEKMNAKPKFILAIRKRSKVQIFLIFSLQEFIHPYNIKRNSTNLMSQTD